MNASRAHPSLPSPLATLAFVISAPKSIASPNDGLLRADNGRVEDALVFARIVDAFSSVARSATVVLVDFEIAGTLLCSDDAV